MTTDAKIGLLLGLVFIFIIAFIINGLPKFRRSADNNELTTNMAGWEDESPGIADKERQARETLDWTIGPEDRPSDEIPKMLADDQDIRLIIPMPEDILTPKEPAPGTDLTTAADVPLSPAPGAEKTQVEEPKPVKPSWPKTYVVRQGDVLADIAKTFYGPAEGNKKANIDRIFRANRNLLTSPDEIYAGQKLIIPPLPGSTSQDSAQPPLSRDLFERVKSIGRKRLLTDDRKVEPGRWYVVKDGDNLWKIAAEQLGSGGRYKEISTLNTNILEDENEVDPGMRLRLPPQ